MNREENLKNIALLLSQLKDREETESFLEELLTEKELSDVSLRIELMKQLREGKTQRAIASNLHVSLCKVTRGNRYIKDSESIINKLLARAEEDNHE